MLQGNNTNASAVGAHILPPTTILPGHLLVHYPLNVNFTEFQLKAQFTPETRQLKTLLKNKVQKKEFFYGIEILARSFKPNITLDYNALVPLLPLFTSIVWLGVDYSKFSNINDIEAVILAKKLFPNTIVVPHLTCYGMEEERLRHFIKLNFSNMLVIRGDQYDPKQSYKNSSEMLQAVRKLEGGDAITIGVGGYPQGHPESKSIDEDMDNLKAKVAAGADFIITQICFSKQAIVDFVQRCRASGIDIPIVVGVFVPDNLRMLETMLRVTKIHMVPEELAEYKEQAAKGNECFNKHAVKKSVELIRGVMKNDNVDVYGIQFFTLNKFGNILDVLIQVI